MDVNPLSYLNFVGDFVTVIVSVEVRNPTFSGIVSVALLIS